jgi:hypothetical protein
MKLSVTINFFNGEELLRKTVENIRPLTEHLSIVYQTKSNWGEPITEQALTVLNSLMAEGLVDDCVLYEPDLTLIAAENEFTKRRIGLDVAIKNEATHILLMDADEFYKADEFLAAKQLIEKENIDFSAVNSYFYLHQSIYRSKTCDTTNVCFITKITPELIFEHGQPFPLENIDPTCRLVNPIGKFKLFHETDIAMHHMCFVRSSFESKLKNTSSAANLDFINQVEKILNEWRYPNIFCFPNKPNYELIKVNDFFRLTGIGYGQFPSKKPTVLITNYFILNFTGSELVTLDLARFFILNDYEVTVAFFIYGQPLKSFFDELGVHYLNILTASPQHFDLIWAHHFVALDTCLLDRGITANKVIFSSLSSFATLECPPSSIDKVNLVLANSRETKNTLIDLGLMDDSIEILPNPVSDEYFELSNRSGRTELKKIAIISNHIPAEIKELIPCLQRNNIETVVYGIEGLVEIITPSLLVSFDAVITIGRTVQACMALGVPVYCYDHFGGPGWIVENNVSLAAEFNFSGRCTAQKKDVANIINEILVHFNDTHQQQAFCQNYAKKYFNLNQCIEKIFTKLETSKINYNHSFFKNIHFKQRLYQVQSSEAVINQKNLEMQETKNIYDNKINVLNKKISRVMNVCSKLEHQLNKKNKDFSAREREFTEIIQSQSALCNRLTQDRQELTHCLDEIQARRWYRLLQKLRAIKNKYLSF